MTDVSPLGVESQMTDLSKIIKEIEVERSNYKGKTVFDEATRRAYSFALRQIELFAAELVREVDQATGWLQVASDCRTTHEKHGFRDGLRRVLGEASHVS